MLRHPTFWSEEKEAPLLNRNSGYVCEKTSESACKLISELISYAEEKTGTKIDTEITPECDDDASVRIFTLDAERTFNSEANRLKLFSSLCALWHEIRDYHQGLGFIVAFLSLFVEQEDVFKLGLYLHRYYTPGYFKSAARQYFCDATVYQKILKIKNKPVEEHLKTLPPEAYCSKWFVGFNVHVLPFKALVEYLKFYFQKGQIFQFQFALSLVKNCEKDILSTKDVSRLFAILRLDANVYEDDKKVEINTQEQTDDKKEKDEDKNHEQQYYDESGSFFLKIVRDALDIDLSDIDIEELRNETEEEMKAADELRKIRDAELGSDDEIVFSDEEDE